MVIIKKKVIVIIVGLLMARSIKQNETVAYLMATSSVLATLMPSIFQHFVTPKSQRKSQPNRYRVCYLCRQRRVFVKQLHPTADNKKTNRRDGFPKKDGAMKCRQQSISRLIEYADIV